MNEAIQQEKRRVAILGSTGSIGTQALEVIREQADYLEVEVLTAHNNVDLLIEQSIAFQPNAVVIGNPAHYDKLKEALAPYPVKVYAGEKALCQIVEMDSIDIVLTAMVGFAGLRPTIHAIEAGKPIALANKETLVVAGAYITRLARERGVNIYPVDSEHSAIFQCLVGEFHNPIEKIILTASGGPFRGYSREQLAGVRKEQALKHPNWNMGAKITIDSATLMNKGLEVIEAKWLFGLSPEQIEVVVHPQSIIHSMVQFEDGSIKAQMGLPDMKLPILFALSYPLRYRTSFPRFDFTAYPQLTFEQPDLQAFPCLRLAYEALRQGGNMPCVLNAANEVAVAAFLQDQIDFLDIPVLIESCMQRMDYIADPSPEDYFATDRQTREYAKEALKHV
ncbi:MAG: 1-deoxy-D-xylulose 5-phosphate reductoisomerase [Thermonema sp.]|jgi:1-deoxy-D-xylulose-5-phosphate reductoisomerase|uniref:1-deoxy-D-xylulose-5-phosphate reductoisomerase n=1 Tax=Thermonema TaxID=28194 RepID=UPI00056E79F1|nr:MULTISPECIES: 1-deoxy-D-xylulose-5-phosphate reductoisomerase [Thermonema]GIV40436.1 MAG: 1-deoxy-D-xylulose 5-phosphate reductoisomerase [Thermonema sp.]